MQGSKRRNSLESGHWQRGTLDHPAFRRELRDRIVDLRTLAAEFATALGARAARFIVDPADREFWALLEAQLLSHPIDSRTDAAVATLESTAGQSAVAATATAAAMSIRALQTRFLECVGLSAKEFARILRLQALQQNRDGEDAWRLAAAFIRGYGWYPPPAMKAA